jgi:predicted SAM-dependent methyltransferase
MKVDLGCGNAVRGEDYIGVDKFVPAGIRSELEFLPFLDNSIDDIWSSHALEHFPMGKINSILKEWFRILKPSSGKAIIQVPNFDYVARYWFTGENRGWAEMMIFGNQAHDGEFHKCAFTAATLKGDLEAAGFHVERVEYVWNHSQETLQAIARKKLEKAA